MPEVNSLALPVEAYNNYFPSSMYDFSLGRQCNAVFLISPCRKFDMHPLHTQFHTVYRSELDCIEKNMDFGLLRLG
jgi:hypothetical protein